MGATISRAGAVRELMVAAPCWAPTEQLELSNVNVRMGPEARRTAGGAESGPDERLIPGDATRLVLRQR